MGQQNHMIFQNSGSFGNKVMSGIKNTAEVVGAGKTMYDVGKGLWQGFQYVRPSISTMLKI